jgi:hypothetical protein
MSESSLCELVLMNAGSPSVPKAMFGAFVKLRFKNPDLARPYRIPVGTVGAAVMCASPVMLITTVMCLESARTVLINAVVGQTFFILASELWETIGD